MYRLSAILQTLTGQRLKGDFAKGLFPPPRSSPPQEVPPPRTFGSIGRGSSKHENRMRQSVALVETAKAVAQEEAKNDEGETRPNFGQVSTPARGPSIKPGSYRDIEERAGIPQPTIRLAEQHVATLEAHPDVEAAPQSVTVAVGPLSGGKAPALYGKWVGVLTLSTPLEGGSGFFCLAESNILNRRTPTDDLLLSPDEELHSLIVDEVHGIPYTVYRGRSPLFRVPQISCAL